MILTLPHGLSAGIDVHFLHVKPKKVPEGTTAIPLIVVHGWPGSFYEFYGLIPLLTEPSNPNDLVFEVVCPSIPGYGFSEAPHKKGDGDNDWFTAAHAWLPSAQTCASPCQGSIRFAPPAFSTN